MAAMRALTLLGVSLLGLLLCGCGTLDYTSYGNPSRVLVGTVNFGDPQLLPQDAVLTVRLIDTSKQGLPQVLGSQTIKNPGTSPVAYKIEYTAEDDLLRRGLNIEARISYGGRLRLYNVNEVSVKLSNVSDPHTVWLNSASR